MKIDLTESEYRIILTALAMRVEKSCTRLRDSLRVRWERAADEEQKEAGK